MGNNMNIDKQKLFNAIVNSTDSKINKDSLNRAKKGDVSELISQLSDADQKKLKAALNDKKLAKEILSSKEAKNILKNFLGGKGNG